MPYELAVIVLIVLTATTNNVQAARKGYDDHRVYRLSPSTAAHFDTLKKLDCSESVIFLNGMQGYVIVTPGHVDNFTASLKRAGIPHTLVEKNAQKSLDREQDVPAVDGRAVIHEYNWTNYQLLATTNDWLHALAKKYPQQVSVFVAGISYEGRELLGVKISYNNDNNGCGKKCGIFIEGGLHAREWISPATTTYIINQLLTSKDARVRKIAESHVWYVVPHTNPDGFVYTHTTDRLWRKTRTPYKPCVGADPNRNWNFHWLELGSSNNTCEQEYAGPKPFSEIEMRTLANYISSIKNKLVLYLSLHSFGQKLISPYGYTSTLPATYKNLKRVSDVAVAAISKRYGTKYTGGTAYQIEYPYSGSSTDWAYGEANIPYVYSYELRPVEDVTWDGFILPASQIIPTGEETLDSVVAMIEEIDKLEK